jgi:hypothetical protein
MQDSNLRMPESKSGALPTWLIPKVSIIGVPEGIRTPDTRLRRAVLYPAELQAHNWSGRRDSNPRPSPWQGDALPLSHFRKKNGADGGT